MTSRSCWRRRTFPRGLERINKHLAKEIEVQQLRTKIQTEVQDSVQSSQADYYLREQLKRSRKSWATWTTPRRT